MGVREKEAGEGGGAGGGGREGGVSGGEGEGKGWGWGALFLTAKLQCATASVNSCCNAL